MYNHIRQHLPQGIQRIDATVKESTRNLKALGTARKEPREHRAYLGSIAKDFDRLSRDTIRGLYTNHTFFPSIDPKVEQFPYNDNKLHSCLRTLNRGFIAVMATKGASRTIRMPDGSLTTDKHTDIWPNTNTAMDLYNVKAPVEISWADFKAEFDMDAIVNEGTELPGSKNPWLGFRKFKEQVQPWRQIAKQHIELVLDITRSFIDNLLKYNIVDSQIQDRIIVECVEPFFIKRKAVMSAKLKNCSSITMAIMLFRSMKNSYVS